MTITEYNYPITIPGSYFNRRIAAPITPIEFNLFLSTYHLDYLRYLYFFCIMGAEGEYPTNITFEEIKKAFTYREKKCAKRIKMILIGEAPPPNYSNYFYNIHSPWNNMTGKPSRGQFWTSSIKNALFPNDIFLSKVDFLIACAKKGFLLIDLFPYPISYSGRSTKLYRNACEEAFCGAAYPINLINQLNSITCCIAEEISIGFAMKTFGENILSSPSCVRAFNAWQAANRITLNPPENIDVIRIPLIVGASNYLRVFYRGGHNGGGPMGPCAHLMNLGGFRCV